MTEVEDHNGPQWLEIRHAGIPRMGKGWFVVRICPCHRNVAVTLPLDSREYAERAVAALLAVRVREQAFDAVPEVC